MAKSSTGNNGSGDGKLKALEEAIGQIEKRFGKGSIMRMGESGGRMAVEVIPFNSPPAARGLHPVPNSTLYFTTLGTL